MVKFGSDGPVDLIEVTTPNTNIPPGGTFEVIATVTNSASFIIGDPDGCSNAGTPCSGKDGYCIRAIASVLGGGESSMTQCVNLPFSGTGTNQEQMSQTLTAPDTEGQHSVTVYLEGSASGNRSNAKSATIEVATDSTGSDDDPDDGDDPDGGNGKSLFQIATENPAGTLVVGVGATMALREVFSFGDE